MSKGNLFLGQGRGKLGDIVLYRLAGQQVARSRNRHPKNPRTPWQLVQRVLMKSASLGYSMVQDIANHAFQGLAEGTPNQSRFAFINVAKGRKIFAKDMKDNEWSSPVLSMAYNFARKADTLAPFFPFQISEGTLPPVPVRWGADLSSFSFVIDSNLGSATPTYQDIVDALGLQQGDQLTFCCCSIDDTAYDYFMTNFVYGRVILEPSDGDMSSPFISNGAVNKPNPRNEGNITLSIDQTAQGAATPGYYLAFIAGTMVNAAQSVNSVCAGAVIASRLTGGVWQRSSQSLVLRPVGLSEPGNLNNEHENGYMGEALESFMTNTNSSLYLNQAENF